MAQCRTRGGTVITRETICPRTGDGDDNPCGNCYLADTVVMLINNIHVIYVEGRVINGKEIEVSKSNEVPAESTATP